MSESDSIDVLRRIREGGDVNTILGHVKDGNLLMELALKPETRRRYGLPCTIDMPAFLLMADNYYLDSTVHETTLRSLEKPSGMSDNSLATRATDYDSAYLKPYHAAKIGDPLLLQVMPSQWTSVTTKDSLLRELLSTYFLYQHQCYFPFHKDLFLQDMIAGETRFCSSLLVNAVLALAYHSYQDLLDRNKFELPQNLGYRFTVEAKRLWELEKLGKSKLTTIHAAIILYIKMNISGKDKMAPHYTLQAIAMTHDLQLFKASTLESITGERMKKARIFTAWSLFSWQAGIAYYFLRSPYMQDAPEMPLPDLGTDPDWYGEAWIRYPLNQTLTPCLFGHTMKAKAGLRHILNDMAKSFAHEEKPGNIRLRQVLIFKARLDEWYKNLPAPLTPKNIVFPTQLELHIEYQTVVLQLFNPQVALSLDDSTILATMQRTSQQIVADAKIRLETLIRLYYLRHSFDSYHCSLQYYITVLVNIAIQSMHAVTSPVTEMLLSAPMEAFRSTLILCAHGLKSQGRCYHVSNLTFLVLQNYMRTEDVQLLRTYVASGDADAAADIQAAKPSHSEFPLPIIKINIDPALSRIDHLLREYEMLYLDEVSSVSS